jgi:hypothetical protein
MVARHTATRQVFVSVGILGLLAGCAATPMGPTVQVMPGPGKSFSVFQADLAECKYFAAGQVQGQADAANQRAAGGAVLTTLLGAGLGAAIGGAAGNAGAGAAIGAAAGAGGGAAYGTDASANAQFGIQQQYDNAFAQCMYAKGDQVPGWTPPPVVYSYGVAAPAPGPVAVADPLVRSTQSELIRLGYLRDSADGFIGPKTHAAIANFQQANGLTVDGNPSPRLLATLQSTPNSASAPTASAPSPWVAPVGSGGSAAAPPAAPGGWVQPTPTRTQ